MEISMKMHRIKEALAANGFNQRDMARMIGISTNAMSAICRNESQPKLETIYRIARILRVQPSALLIEVDWEKVTDTDFDTARHAVAA